MDNYRYTPINVTALLLVMFCSYIFLTIITEDFNFQTVLKVLFSGYIYVPLLCIFLFKMDYDLQKIKPKYYLIFEFIVAILIIFQLLKGLENF